MFFILISLAITGFYAVNLFSKKGLSVLNIEVDKQENTEAKGNIENRLSQLEALKEKGLINEEEFQQKKAEILKEF